LIGARAGAKRDAAPCYDFRVPLLTWDPIRGLVILETDRGDADPGWAPPIDVVETHEAFVISAELAGVAAEDVEVGLQGDRVFLRGARPERALRPEQYHRIERGHGRFSRTVALPPGVDVDGIKAVAADGVVTITLPKSRRPEPRRVPVE
jgi:HSP20 family protein